MSFECDGQTATRRTFSGVLDGAEWHGVAVHVIHGNMVFGIIGLTSAETFQFQEAIFNKIIKTFISTRAYRVRKLRLQIRRLKSFLDLRATSFGPQLFKPELTSPLNKSTIEDVSRCESQGRRVYS